MFRIIEPTFLLAYPCRHRLWEGHLDECNNREGIGYLMGTVSSTGNGTARTRRRGRSHPGLPSSSSGGLGERQDTEDTRQGKGLLRKMEQKQSINITNIKSLNFKKMSPRGEHL